MPRQLRLQNTTQITVADTPFASGGEGDLFTILEPARYRPFVFKALHDDKRPSEKQPKLHYLVQHPPRMASYGGPLPVVWPDSLVFDGATFVGFMMPKAEGIILEKLCLLTLPSDLGAEWQKFGHTHPNALQNRVKLCANMAVALFQIHENGHYTIVDLKPQNVLVQSDGHISIIDVDSFQVHESNQILFHAQVMTPDYTPPEAYQRDIRPKEHYIDQWFRQKSGGDSAVSSEFVIAGMIFHHSRVKSELLHK